jgi:hypothetical protein
MDNHTQVLAFKVVCATTPADSAVETLVEDFADGPGSVVAQHPVIDIAADGCIASTNGNQFGALAAARVHLLAAVRTETFELGNHTFNLGYCGRSVRGRAREVTIFRDIKSLNTDASVNRSTRDVGIGAGKVADLAADDGNGGCSRNEERHETGDHEVVGSDTDPHIHVEALLAVGIGAFGSA